MLILPCNQYPLTANCYIVERGLQRYIFAFVKVVRQFEREATVLPKQKCPYIHIYLSKTHTESKINMFFS